MVELELELVVLKRLNIFSGILTTYLLYNFFFQENRKYLSTKAVMGGDRGSFRVTNYFTTYLSQF